MTIAYVLVNTELGKEAEALERLQNLRAVKESYHAYGVYDILLKVEAEDVKDLKDTVFSEIRQVDSVKNSLTMIVIN